MQYVYIIFVFFLHERCARLKLNVRNEYLCHALFTIYLLYLFQHCTCVKESNFLTRGLLSIKIFIASSSQWLYNLETSLHSLPCGDEYWIGLSRKKDRKTLRHICRFCLFCGLVELIRTIASYNIRYVICTINFVVVVLPYQISLSMERIGLEKVKTLGESIVKQSFL